MNKIFKHKILAGAMLFGFMLAGSSCEDNVGIRVTPETPFADKTLYEVVKNDPDLSDFLAVVDACGSECADSLFNQARVYTLWAPVNDAVDEEALIAQAQVDREHVFRTFVLAHIANHTIPANGTLDSDNTVMLLNKKLVHFTGNQKSGYTFSGVELDPQNTNIRVKNGLVHKIVKPSEYKYSIWEYLKIAEGVDSVAKYLYSFDVVEFNAGQSFPGPLNSDGEQTYIDSVFTTSNRWLTNWKGVGNIDNEDSTYIVYVPSNEMWNRMVAKAETYYKYNTKTSSSITKDDVIERDSLGKYYARLNNLKYMTYSVNEQQYVESPDSAMPAYRDNTGKHAFFAKADIEKNVISEKELSNGVFKVVDAMPYSTIALWHDTIFVEGEDNTWWNYSDKPAENTKPGISVESVSKSNINGVDSTLQGAEVSGERYFWYQAESSTVTAKFRIPKVLSAEYYVAIIFVPANITNERLDTAQVLGSKLRFTLKQGTTELFKNTSNGLELYTKPLGLDTLFLRKPNGEKAIIKPNFCEFFDGLEVETKDYTVTLDITTRGPSSDEKDQGLDFDRSIRIDKIMFIPVPEKE